MHFTPSLCWFPCLLGLCERHVKTLSSIHPFNLVIHPDGHLQISTVFVLCQALAPRNHDCEWANWVEHEISEFAKLNLDRILYKWKCLPECAPPFRAPQPGNLLHAHQLGSNLFLSILLAQLISSPQARPLVAQVGLCAFPPHPLQPPPSHFAPPPHPFGGTARPRLAIVHFMRSRATSPSSGLIYDEKWPETARSQG